jgi:hypothetical protein
LQSQLDRRQRQEDCGPRATLDKSENLSEKIKVKKLRHKLKYINNKGLVVWLTWWGTCTAKYNTLS